MADVDGYACEDIGDILRQMREIDDKIIYELNLATPTQSFRGLVNPTEHCRELFEQLEKTYNGRGRLIQRCLNLRTDKVKELITKKEEEGNNPLITSNIREEQRNIRELRSEMAIEEIVRQRSTKVFDERCKQFYRSEFKGK
ncbi:coiled-coil domain-containing 58 isoform X2 [Oratosquilla oratoria]|uniref:coiled-coil domain-containing 58 isoform X2 n=1 Tax=Oratosquilla oratoria TaxID=337810 RepID=UPI003F76DDD3